MGSLNFGRPVRRSKKQRPNNNNMNSNRNGHHRPRMMSSSFYMVQPRDLRSLGVARQHALRTRLAFAALSPSCRLGRCVHGMAYTEDSAGAGRWYGARIGRYLRRSLGGAQEVDVVFCPGMGDDTYNLDQIYTFWGALRIWSHEWHTFDRDGLGLDANGTASAPRPYTGDRPVLDRLDVEELKMLVAARAETAPPVVLLGVFTGAYLAMTAARELCAEGFPVHRVAVIAFNTAALPVDRGELPSDVPGVVIAGERELHYMPHFGHLSVRAEDGNSATDRRHVALGDLPGGRLLDGFENLAGIDGYAGPSPELRHLNHVLPACLVFTARVSMHCIRDCTWALRRGSLQQCSGPGIPSTHTCSSRSSLSSRAEVRSLSW